MTTWKALAVLYLYAASTAGHPGALMAMGYRHLHGYGVPQVQCDGDMCTTQCQQRVISGSQRNIVKHFQQIKHVFVVCIAFSGWFWRMVLSSLFLEYLSISCHHNFAKQLMFQACTTAALNYIDVAKGVASIYSDLHVSRG